jgi:hypothetical protein
MKSLDNPLAIFCSKENAFVRFRSSVQSAQDDMRNALQTIGCDDVSIREILRAFCDPSTHIASGFRFEEKVPKHVVYVTYYHPLIDKDLLTLQEIAEGKQTGKNRPVNGWVGVSH